MKTFILTIASLVSLVSFSQETDKSIDCQIELKKSEIYYAIINDACCEDIEVMEIELSRLEDIQSLPKLETKKVENILVAKN